MKPMPILGALALAVTATAMPAAAQYRTYDNRPTQGYDTNAFWREAPDGLSQRIAWLQQRIQQGMADGSLDRAEARRAQYQLNVLRSQADTLQRRLDDLSRSIRWARNDDRYNRYGNGAYTGAYAGTAVRDPYVTDYDASRYYRDGPQYQERRLTAQDEVYRGSDGQYYCKRNDGSTGLVIGGVGGAGLGALIAGGHNGVAGALIGGALGALVGKQVDQNSADIRCR